MNEMAHRGYRMQPISLEKSQAFEFIIEGDTLIPPFISVTWAWQETLLETNC